MPKISVILAIYNVEQYLKRCLDSLSNQTLKDLEFICVDDCSTDNSLEILREYEAKDLRFKIISSEVNGGAAVARNKGLDVARGEYLSFIDSDDSIDLNFYEELYKIAISKDADIVKGQCVEIETNGKRHICINHEKIKKEGLFAFIYEWTTAIYKSSIIYNNKIRFNEKIRKAQDSLFLNQVVLNAKNIELSNNVAYYYYRRNGSLDSGMLSLENFKSNLKSRELILQDINNAKIFENNLNKDIYNYRYALQFSRYFRILFKTDNQEAKYLWAESAIKSFWNAKDIKALERTFEFKSLLPYFKKKNSNALTLKVLKYKKLKELKKYDSSTKEIILKKIIKNIFSIQNCKEKNKIHKVITILGFRIKFKIKNNNRKEY